MTAWTEFAAAWAVFLLSHAVPVRPPVKPWLVARIGAPGFGLAYSALSLAVLVWLIGAAGRAPHLEIWPRAGWQTWVTVAAMTLACQMLAFALFAPNPYSFGGWRNGTFDPARAGLLRLTRHPLLAALALWSLGHLAPNGDLAHLLLFGGFAGFALLGGRMIDRRRRRALGVAVWAERAWRRCAGAAVRWRPGHAGLRVAAGLALTAALILLHPLVIGLPVPILSW